MRDYGTPGSVPAQQPMILTPEERILGATASRQVIESVRELLADLEAGRVELVAVFWAAQSGGDLVSMHRVQASGHTTTPVVVDSARALGEAQLDMLASISGSPRIPGGPPGPQSQRTD